MIDGLGISTAHPEAIDREKKPNLEHTIDATQVELAMLKEEQETYTLTSEDVQKFSGKNLETDPDLVPTYLNAENNFELMGGKVSMFVRTQGKEKLNETDSRVTFTIHATNEGDETADVHFAISPSFDFHDVNPVAYYIEQFNKGVDTAIDSPWGPITITACGPTHNRSITVKDMQPGASFEFGFDLVVHHKFGYSAYATVEQNGIEDTKKSHVHSPEELEKRERSQWPVRLSPNPVSVGDDIRLMEREHYIYTINNYTIINALGQVVDSRTGYNQQTISTQGLAAGRYTLIANEPVVGNSGVDAPDVDLKGDFSKAVDSSKAPPKTITFLVQ